MSKTKLLAEASILTTISAFILTFIAYINLIDFITPVIVPFFFSLITIRCGLKYGGLSAITTFLIITMSGFLKFALIILMAGIIPGVVIGYGIKNKKRFLNVLSIGTISFIISFTILNIILELTMGFNVLYVFKNLNIFIVGPAILMVGVLLTTVDYFVLNFIYKKFGFILKETA